MAFDDFVIEPNLVSCLRTNEADRENSGREEYSCLQTGEGETAGKKKAFPVWSELSQVLKTAVTPPYFLITAVIVASLCRAAALDLFILCVAGGKKERTDGGEANFISAIM